MQTKKQHEVRQVCLKLGGDKAQYSHTVSSEARRMAIDQINWSQFLQPGSELPPDVTFRVVEGQPGSDEGDVTKSECECECQCECDGGDDSESGGEKATTMGSRLQKYALISFFSPE